MGGLIALGTVAGYLFIAWGLVAPRLAARWLQASINRHPSLYKKADEIREERHEQAIFASLAALLWPGLLIGLLIVKRVAAAAPLTSQEAQAKMRDQENRIAELERELGIGGRA